MDPAPIYLTLKLALLTTAILTVISIPLAVWLLQRKSMWRALLQVLVSLPLVLPPTVIGFYLLIAFSPSHALGNFLEQELGLRLVFSFGGLLLGSVVYSLPFMIHPILAGLTSLPPHLKEASYSLGKSKSQTLFHVLLPNIKPAMLTGIVLTFAHTIGEFGVVLMIGGNIPGKTSVASIAIYDQVEALQYHSANQYALTLVLISVCSLCILYFFQRKKQTVNIL